MKNVLEMARRHMKPMQEAEQYVLRDEDKDCLEKRYIDSTIG